MIRLMKLRSRLLVAFAALSFALSPLAALAHEYKIGDLVIHHPWTRATAPGAPVAGGYAEIHNMGAAPDRLLSATFEGASAVEIHEMKMEGDVMKMGEVPGGLEIPAGGMAVLEPGGFHIMFMGLSRQLKEGEKIKGTLVFEKAGKIEVEFAVDKMGAKAKQMDHSTHGDPAKTN